MLLESQEICMLRADCFFWKGILCFVIPIRIFLMYLVAQLKRKFVSEQLKPTLVDKLHAFHRFLTQGAEIFWYASAQ